MKAHRLAAYFPLMEDEEFNLLVEDIRANGQLQPIITHRGEILDGVNRARACEILDIKPRSKEYNGDDPLTYVISANIRRRHMDVSQRSMLATEMLPEFEKQAKKRKADAARAQRPKGSTAFTPSKRSPEIDLAPRAPQARDDAAREFGVSGSSVRRAKRVKEQAPDKVADIIAGKETVSAADTELRQKAADARAAKRQDKADNKTIKEHPQYVSTYLEATKRYKEALILACKGAARIPLAPETQQFIKSRHGQIRLLVKELEAYCE